MEKFSAAYMFLVLPAKFIKSDYKNLLTQIHKCDNKVADKLLNSALEENIILFDSQKRLELNQEYKKAILEEFNFLKDYKKEYFINQCCSAFLNYYAPTPCYEIIKNYLSIIGNTACDITIGHIDRQIYLYISDEKADLKLFVEVMQIFASPLVPENVKMQLISLLYKYNQNKLVVFLYNSIENKDDIPYPVLIEISASHFMISEIGIANKILEKIVKTATEKEIKTAVEIVRLINNYESQECDKDAIKQKFDNLVNTLDGLPNCANLLLKISSSILSHDEAIKFMIKSKLGTNTVQIYNNIGALYLTEGYKKFVANHKDKNYLTKAKTYLEFAKTLSKEQGLYLPYLEINLLTLQFCNTFRGNAIRKKNEYKRIYKKFISLKEKADSTYFCSIIACNCYILEKLINYKETPEFKNYLSDTLFKTSDDKVKEKIGMFLSFTHSSTVLPVWIITETHY